MKTAIPLLQIYKNDYNKNNNGDSCGALTKISTNALYNSYIQIKTLSESYSIALATKHVTISFAGQKVKGVVNQDSVRRWPQFKVGNGVTYGKKSVDFDRVTR